MCALLSSLNAVFAWAPNGIKQAIKDGWFPEKFAQENKRFGTPHWLLLMYYLVGMYPILLGQEIKAVSVIGANVGLIFAIFPVMAIAFLEKKNPEAYKNYSYIFKLGLYEGTRSNNSYYSILYSSCYIRFFKRRTRKKSIRK